MTTSLAGGKLVEQTFKIDFYFHFINFQMYTLENVSAQAFTMISLLLSGVFFAFLLIMFVISSQAFDDSKTEDIKENSKLVLNTLTIIMSLYLFLFQIPFITILLQAYLCEEDPNLMYTISDMACDSTNHRVLMVVSTLTLMVYLAFLVL